jgi:diphthine synthase
MTISEAIKILLRAEEKRAEKVFTGETLCVGCARLGSDSKIIRFGKAKKIVNESFGKPPYCLIVPTTLHFVEEEALKSQD